MLKNHINNSCGFSLIELIVFLTVILVLSIGVLSLVVLSVQMNIENKNIITATAIANQIMERIRNLQYDQVGVLGGIPYGQIPQVETINRDGIYTIRTYITFYNDPFDGESASSTPRDDIIVDYKIATVVVSWEGKNGPREVKVFSKIIPRTEETWSGYGLLKIMTVDANGAPLPGASVRIINTLTATSVDVTNLSDQQGLLYFPAYASFQGYKVIVTKAGFGIDQTFPITPENPQPTKINLSVTEGDKTEESFSIDRLSVLRIRTVNNNLPENWRVNEITASSTKSSPSLKRDGSDNLYFAWQSVNSTSSIIFVQKYNSTGAKQWSADKKVYDSMFQKRPDLATAVDGRSFIIWQDDSIQLKLLTLGAEVRLAAEKFNIDKNIISEQIDIANTKISFSPNGTNLYNKTVLNTIKELTYSRFFSFRKIYRKLFTQLNSANIFISSFLSQPHLPKMARADTGTVGAVGVGPGATTGDTNSIILSVPAGVQNGDLLLAYIYHDNYGDGPMVAPPGLGWQTLINNLQPNCTFWESGCNSRGAIFWKIVAPGNPANYTFTLSNSHTEQKAGHIRAYRETDTSSPFDGNIAETTSPTGDIFRPAPSHTVNNNGSMLVCGWGTDTSNLGNVMGGPTFPAGMSNSINNFATDITAASADLPVNIADSPTGNKNFDANKNVDRKTINWSIVIKPALLPDDVTVSAIGNQTANILIPSANQYLGGGFVLSDNNSSHTITGVTISEQGTVEADDNLSNIKLYYDFDMTAPFDCVSESFSSSTDPQFGSTTNFNGANGLAIFTPAVGITISTIKSLCLYTVADINSGAIKNDTLEIQINNPAADVSTISGTVIPAVAVIISGTTGLLAPTALKQTHYRWRNDDSGEATSTWQQPENIPTSVKVNEAVRLRMEIANLGSLTSPAINYRLEYGEKITTCENIVFWQALPNDNSLAWRMSDSLNIIDGSNTTNNSGISDENPSFIPGEIKDVGNQTNNLILTGTEFTEIEFSIKATNNVSPANYCFRLTNAGSIDSFSYNTYPEISIIGDKNIYILGLDSDGNELWPIKRVNADLAGEDQTNPRIGIIENGGTATTVIAWEDMRNGNLDIYAQSFDEDGNKLWPSDIPIANSLNIERWPAVAITDNGEVYIAWIAEEMDNLIYVSKLDLLGNPVWPSPISIATSSNEYNINFIMGETGFLYLSLTEKNGADKNARLIKLDTGGTAVWSRLANRETDESDQYSASVAYFNNILYTAWTDKREGNEDIYAQKYDIDGNPLWAEDQRINIHTDASNQNSPTLIVATDNTPFSAWSDSRNNDSNIYATRFNDPGALNGVTGVPIIIIGTSRIGENPIIYEHMEEYTTDASGYAQISVEWDIPGYMIALKTASTSLNLIFSAPTQPVPILPAQTVNALLYVE